MATLFISPTYIKNNSMINANVDDKYLVSTIDLVQKMYLIPILGTDLFNEISTQISGNTLSANNQTLLESYIHDVLLYYTLYEGLPIFLYKIENKALVKKSGEYSQPVDNEELQMFRDMFKDRAEFFSQRCTKYLMENATSTTYATYLTGNTGIDDVSPEKNNYQTGWVLDGDSVKLDTKIEIDLGKINYYK